MNKICTSLEQSKKLIELGIDVNTADMYWDYDIQKHEDYPMVMDEQFDDCCIRAWSLPGLLELIPEVALSQNIDKSWDIASFADDMSFGPVHEIENIDSSIDAAFEMICWLKENGKI